MKRLIFAGGLSLGLVVGAFGSPLPGYTNSGYVATSHLVIDATNVVNLGFFDISLPDGEGQFGFSDVLTYTNRNVMFCTTGFHFNNSPASFGNIGPSVSFVNQNPGQVYGGALDIPVSLTLAGSGSAPRLIIEATNIINSGILQVGQAGEIRASGSSLDFSHGTALVEGFDQVDSGFINGGLVLGPGEFINFWGGGLQSNSLFISNLSAAQATTPTSRVTNSDYSVGTFFFFIKPPNTAALTNIINPSNIYTQVILYLDSGPNNDGFSQVDESAYFLPQTVSQSGATNFFRTAVVKWGVQVTDAFGQTHSNTLFLTDDLGSFPNTNLTFATNNFTIGNLAELVPSNYTIGPTFRGGPLTNTGNGPYSASLFTNGFGTNGDGIGAITNAFTMLGLSLQPVTAQPDATRAGSTVSNVAGRVEITAGQSLNLAGAVINAGNYLNLSSPNDYRGSQGAQISFPYADINLGSSNGQMTISNLVVPYLARFKGPIWAWTGAWTNLTMATNIVITSSSTNTNTFTVTNAFMVTMVGSQLAVTTPPNIESLLLRSTNLSISDSLNISSNMVINTQNLTIASNAPGGLTPAGSVVFAPTDGSELYSANFPSMQNFTNYGSLTTTNAAFFQVRQNPIFPMAGDGPWQSIVNHGTIASPGPQATNGGGGLTFWANYFENTGTSGSSAVIEASGSAFGPVFVQASTALITNGFLTASDGDMQVISGSLTLNNAGLSSSGYLNLGASNLLTDLTASGGPPLLNPINSLSSGDGFSLVTAPTFLSGLLGTAVTSSCRAGAVCQNFWAGVPVAFATNVAGTPLPTMANNAPIGQLILDGGNNNSVFHFQGFQGGNIDTVNPYAMYVDEIQLLDGATNLSPGTTNGFTAFSIDPNVTIYFLKAALGAGNQDISATLNGASGGRLVWLKNNVGHFSVTRVTYADGQTFAVNSSYVQAYGLPPEPPVPLTPQNIQLQIQTTNVGPTPMAAISWYAQAHSTNTLYYRTMTNPAWLVRTNFVQGATAGRVTNLDSLSAGHLYKVSVAQ